MLAKPFSAFGKQGAFLSLFLAAAVSFCADVSVSRGRMNGSIQRVMPFTWSNFDCLVENRDTEAHEITVHLRSKDNDPLSNRCSGSIRLPARTQSRFSFPVFSERIETYCTDVFCDGVKQPADIYNDMTVRLLSYRDHILTVLNDSSVMHLDWDGS